MLTINSHDINISIAGGVEDMVCDPNSIVFFSQFFFSFFTFIILNLF